jgi:hypothetical protein
VTTVVYCNFRNKPNLKELTMGTNTFNQKPNFPFTYGDEVENDDKRLSNYIVNKLGEKRVQSYLGALAIAMLTLGSQAKPVGAIPPEYGEAANEVLNQVAQNGAVASGILEVPPLGEIQVAVGVAPGNPPYVLNAMPIEQQRLIAAQQAGQIGAMQRGPTSSPSFYLPAKPSLTATRAVNTVAFTAAMGVICMNAAWGEPVAILMCTSGLVGIAYKLGKEVVIFMAKAVK